MVIIAGSVVRMTGSGMGCPDWPKCFGHFIPPTDKSELLWQPHQDFEEGQVIIRDESLKVAKSDFTTQDSYDPGKWKAYTKHDYAEFNPVHTWTEFINRLFGMLSGIGVLIMAIVGTFAAIFRFAHNKKRIILLSWAAVALLGFEAWLGAVVVYSVLQPLKITIHMVTSMFIIAILLYLLNITRIQARRVVYNKLFKTILILSLGLTLVQIILGTQVRQFVDEQIKTLGDSQPGAWLLHPPVIFYIHRSFSILLLVINGFLWWKNQTSYLGHKFMNSLMGLVILESLIGIALYYFDFPFLSQPLHLLGALLMFTLQFYILLHSLRQQPKMILKQETRQGYDL